MAGCFVDTWFNEAVSLNNFQDFNFFFSGLSQMVNSRGLEEAHSLLRLTNSKMVKDDFYQSVLSDYYSYWSLA